VGLFLAGCALFMIDLVLAAARSRDDAMGIGGLFFLAGSAPRGVQRHLLGSLAVQVVVAVGAAALDPFTPLAFGTLVPTIGLAFCGLWAVRHGLFPARTS
jgi:tetrahydromethanopterin S-methyltransferase subunit C